MVMQVRRTLTVGATPTGLAEGQISVGMADQPPTAWVGVPTSVNPAGVIPITGLVRTVAGAPQPAGALGQLWWDEDAAQLFVYTGSEWVVAVNPPIPDLSQFATQDWVLQKIPDVPDYVSIVPLGGRLGIVGAVQSTQLNFAPFNGNFIHINGVDYLIPSAGLTTTITNCVVDGTAGQALNPSGPSGGQYFVYVFNAAGTLTIEFSATGYAVSSQANNLGTVIKQGDDSRTLIGLVQINATMQFYDYDGTRWVRSWFNRPSASLNLAVSFTAGGGTSNPLWTTVFADDVTMATANMAVQNSNTVNPLAATNVELTFAGVSQRATTYSTSDAGVTVPLSVSAQLTGVDSTSAWRVAMSGTGGAPMGSGSINGVILGK